MNLTLSIESAGHESVVHVAGDLDYATSNQFVVTVSKLLDERPDLRQLHLNFAKLEFCGSAGLSALLDIHRRTSASGQQLYLDERPAQLDRVLQLTGLLKVFTPESDAPRAETD